jgi:hypothetical protein
MRVPLSADVPDVLALSVFHASVSALFLRRFRYAYLSLTSPCDHDSSFIQDPHTYYIYWGLLQTFRFVQMFVLGPRLILGVREYHAKLVANSDTTTEMTSIAFQEPVHVSTSSSV